MVENSSKEGVAGGRSRPDREGYDVIYLLKCGFCEIFPKFQRLNIKRRKRRKRKKFEREKVEKFCSPFLGGEKSEKVETPSSLNGIERKHFNDVFGKRGLSFLHPRRGNTFHCPYLFGYA